MEILDDPQNTLKAFTDVIATYSKTLAAHSKDKTVEVSETPSKYYIRHCKEFTNALNYYNQLLNTHCPKDIPMDLSIEIRKKREKYYTDLAKLVHGVDFA